MSEQNTKIPAPLAPLNPAANTPSSVLERQVADLTELVNKLQAQVDGLSKAKAGDKKTETKPKSISSQELEEKWNEHLNEKFDADRFLNYFPDFVPGAKKFTPSKDGKTYEIGY